MTRHSTLALVFAVLVPSVHAQVFEVRAVGEVEFNLVTQGPLGGVPVGSPVEMAMRVDASVFANSPNFPTRGYPVLPGSFALDLGAGVAGLQQPFPAGQTPYFVLRDNDPAVDGFFFSTSVNFPIGVPLNVNGQLGPFRADFSVTYGGLTLSSLDIADAVGSYDFTGLSVFNWTLDDGPFQPVGILFESLHITPVAACGYAAYGDVLPPANDLVLSGVGAPAVGGFLRVSVAITPSNPAFLGMALDDANLPFLGGALFIDPTALILTNTMAPSGAGAGSALPIPATPTLAGLQLFMQALALDPSKPEGFALSNGLRATICP